MKICLPLHESFAHPFACLKQTPNTHTHRQIRQVSLSLSLSLCLPPALQCTIRRLFAISSAAATQRTSLGFFFEWIFVFYPSLAFVFQVLKRALKPRAAAELAELARLALLHFSHAAYADCDFPFLHFPTHFPRLSHHSTAHLHIFHLFAF